MFTSKIQMLFISIILKEFIQRSSRKNEQIFHLASSWECYFREYAQYKRMEIKS